eukprot:5413764-Prorocentrum_lima.AAC.1
MSTLDVVEQIDLWRRAQEDEKEAFLWNGQNYLLKIVSDLDATDTHEALVDWLGHPLRHNPFAVAYSLEDRPATPTAPPTP